MSRLAPSCAALAVLAVACSPRAPTPLAPLGALPEAPAPSSTALVAPAAPPAQAPSAEELAHVRAMLLRVSAVRGLPILRDVACRVLDRDEILSKIKAHVEKDVPLDVAADQGEVLAALELVPPDYDLIAGILRLVGARIAGFYEPEDRTMYLVDDQDDGQLEETLAHELDHALQDQSFPLSPRLKFQKGASDRTTAGHCLIEGDAVSATLDVELGSAMRVSESMIAKLFAFSTALSEVGATTPHVLLEELVSPYTDGFAFVQALRRRGGWAAVDEAWRHPPETTEQLLHIDKYDAREPAITIAAPSVGALGAGWSASLDDEMGEQGVRLIVGEWTTGHAAAAAAAGWGGDRLVVARRAGAAGRQELALAWHVRMDTVKDAEELAAVLSAQMGARCRERPRLGPLTWKRKGAALVVVAGPYAREGGRAAGSAGSCAQASGWVDAILGR